MKILVVEDDPLIGNEFLEAIAEAGYEALGPARSMAAGLYLAQTRSPDLAVIDIGLAGTVNGIEGGRAFASSSLCQSSSYPDGAIRRRAREPPRSRLRPSWKSLARPGR